MKKHNYFTYKGYTLIELLLVLALLVVILCLSIPGWQGLLQNNSTTTQGNKIVAALEYTRILAIKQNKNIAFCRKDFRDGKSNKNWSGGQEVVDVNKSGADSVLHIFSAIPQKDQLLCNFSFKKNDCVVFTPLGIPDGQQGSFDYCHVSGDKAQAIEILLQGTGNIYTHVLGKCPRLQGNN